jgi:hypothetical protein
MVKIWRAAACIAVFGALSIGAGAGLSIESARAADSCAGAPGAAAPKGQHWYYRVDQVNHRKCWYLHSIVPLAAHAAADTHTARSEAQSPPEPAPSPSAATPETTDTANPAGENAGTPPAPRVTVLNVKPVTPPSLDPTSASATAIPEQTDEPPTASVPVEADIKPARPAHVTKMQASVNAAHDMPAPAPSDAATATQTRSAWLLLPLLALALGIAGLLIAFLRKVGASSRAPRLSEHPDDAWRRFHMSDRYADEAIVEQENAPFLAPAEPYGAIDLDTPDWLDQRSPATPDFPRSPRYAKPRQSQRENVAEQDIEQRLRILRQSRRGVVPSGKER